MMVPPLPVEIRDYLVSLTLNCRSAAYFKLTKTGQILDWGGDLETYEITEVEVGAPVWRYLFFIDSFFPLQGGSDQLSCVKFKGDVSVNIHIFTQADTGWLLLLDASYDEEWQSRLQQKGNEFNLLRQQYTKLIQGMLQHRPGPVRNPDSVAVSPSIPLSAIPLSAIPLSAIPLSAIPLCHTQQQESSLLLVKICELLGAKPLRSPRSTLKLLNAYLAIITQIVAAEGGMIHHVFGESAVALFGLLPSSKSPAQQAADAARRMICRFQDLEQDDTSSRPVGLNVGAAISTDIMASGVVQSQEYRSLTALGDNVQRTLHLSEWIRPGMIVIDGRTFDCLGCDQEKFDPSVRVSHHDTLAEQQLYAQDVCHASVYS